MFLSVICVVFAGIVSSCSGDDVLGRVPTFPQKNHDTEQHRSWNSTDSPRQAE